MNTIPVEIQLLILDACPVKNRFKLMLVCTCWHQLITHSRKFRKFKKHIFRCKKYPKLTRYALGMARSDLKNAVMQIFKKTIDIYAI